MKSQPCVLILSNNAARGAPRGLKSQRLACLGELRRRAGHVTQPFKALCIPNWRDEAVEPWGPPVCVWLQGRENCCSEGRCCCFKNTLNTQLRELKGLDWLLPAGLLTWKTDSDFLKQCWGWGGGGAKQETWNTEDHGLPALEMTDGKPHFTDILSSCKAQVAPILSPCLDQVWRRAAPLYGSEAPLLMPIRALCLKRATTDKKTRPPTADNTCHNPSPRPVCRQNVFSKKIINLQVIAKILSGIT